MKINFVISKQVFSIIGLVLCGISLLLPWTYNPYEKGQGLINQLVFDVSQIDNFTPQMWGILLCYSFFFIVIPIALSWISVRFNNTLVRTCVVVLTTLLITATTLYWMNNFTRCSQLDYPNSTLVPCHSLFFYGELPAVFGLLIFIWLNVGSQKQKYNAIHTTMPTVSTTNTQALFYLFNTILLLTQLNSLVFPIVGGWIRGFFSPEFSTRYISILILWPIYIIAVTVFIIFNYKYYIKRKYAIGVFIIITIQLLVMLDASGWCRFGFFSSPPRAEVEACLNREYLRMTSIGIPAVVVLFTSFVIQARMRVQKKNK